MRAFKFLSALVLSVAALGAQAEPVSCQWQNITTVPNVYGSEVTQGCYDGNNAQIATRFFRYVRGNLETCNVTPATGYQFSGACLNPVISRVTPPPTTASSNCGQLVAQVCDAAFSNPQFQAYINSACTSCGGIGNVFSTPSSACGHTGQSTPGGNLVSIYCK